MARPLQINQSAQRVGNNRGLRKAEQANKVSYKKYVDQEQDYIRNYSEAEQAEIENASDKHRAEKVAEIENKRKADFWREKKEAEAEMGHNLILPDEARDLVYGPAINLDQGQAKDGEEAALAPRERPELEETDTQHDLTSEFEANISAHKSRLLSLADKFKNQGETGILLSDAARALDNVWGNCEAVLDHASSDLDEMLVMNLNLIIGILLTNINSAIAKDEIAESAEDLAELNNIKAIYTGVQSRISGEMQKSAQSFEMVKLGTIVQRSYGDIVINSDHNEHTGGQASDVRILKEGEEKRFFKGDTHVKSSLEIFEEHISEFAGIDKDKYEMYREAFTSPTTEKRNMLEGLGFIGRNIRILEPRKNMSYVTRRDYKDLCDRFDALYAECFGVNDPSAREKDLDVFISTLTDMNIHGRMRDTHGITSGNDLTKRNMASERMAELLGMGDILVHNDFATLNEDGQEISGFVMNQAKGAPINKVIGAVYEMKSSDSSSVLYYDIAPQVYKKLTNLQILDSINGQGDRHYGNFLFDYHIDGEKKTLFITNVAGIDNDMAFGTANELNKNRVGNSVGLFENLQDEEDPLKPKKPLNISLNLDRIDSRVLEHLAVLTPDIIRVNMEGLLEPDAIETLIDRVQIVRESTVERPSSNTGINGTVESPSSETGINGTVESPSSETEINGTVRKQFISYLERQGVDAAQRKKRIGAITNISANSNRDRVQGVDDSFWENDAYDYYGNEDNAMYDMSIDRETGERNIMETNYIAGILDELEGRASLSRLSRS